MLRLHFIQTIYVLLKREFDTDFRSKSAIYSLLLYAFGAIFITYLSFQVRKGTISHYTWNALYWIIILFCSINTATKSLNTQKKGQLLYYYHLHHPSHIIFSGIIYSCMLLVVMAMLSLVFFVVLMSNPIQNMPLFLCNMVIVCIGMSAILTLVSYIAAQATGSIGLLAILAFPLLIPMLLFTIKISYSAIMGIGFDDMFKNIILLLSIDVLSIALAYILFPYLWKK